MAKKNEIIPSVLAYEKKLVLSDGYMYGTSWNERYKKWVPLHLVEKAVRGTISNRQKPAVENDPAKLNAEIEKANLQRVDACALGSEQDTLKITFTLKVLSGIEKAAICNNVIFTQKYATAAKTYIDKTGFKELATRYALNLANGRFLWRNRLGAENIEIKVSADGKEWIFDAYKYSLNNFDKRDDVQDLAALIAETLSGTREFLFIKVEAYALLGIGQEVYPSEELVYKKERLEKNQYKKSKILYAVNDVAAMHSQKLGNALRTIDTWYPEYNDSEKPIAIEPYGAVTNLGKAFRNPKEGCDFYTLFDKYVKGDSLNNIEQEHYVMAVLVRGGVFGQSSRE